MGLAPNLTQSFPAVGSPINAPNPEQSIKKPISPSLREKVSLTNGINGAHADSRIPIIRNAVLLAI